MRQVMTGMLLACGMASGAAGQDIVGHWIGSYTCQQGLTAMELTVESADPDLGLAHRGIFAFSAHPSNPGVPSGSFHVLVDELAGGRIVVIPMEWIARPDGYRTVPAEGFVSADGRTFAGTLPSETCTSFEVTRADMQETAKP